MSNDRERDDATGDDSRDVGVVLVAAGVGSRFGGKKQFLELGGKPLILHSLAAFSAIEPLAEIVVVVSAEDVSRARDLIDDTRVSVIAGGARRQDSVERGVRTLGAESVWAVVHDAARPLIRAPDCERFIAALRGRGAAVMGYPSSDSVKEGRDGRVVRSLARETIWLVQTPQGARTATLLAALEEAARRGVVVTDETAALELVGESVTLVEGPRDNIKVTYPEDLALAEFLLDTGHRP